jgi:hypothetical protein
MQGQTVPVSVGRRGLPMSGTRASIRVDSRLLIGADYLKTFEQIQSLAKLVVVF